MITGPSAKQVYCNYVSLREILHIPKGWTCLLQLPQRERDTRTRVCDLCIMHIMATELNLEISFEASLLYLYKKSTIKNYHIKLRLDIIHVCLSDKWSKIWRSHCQTQPADCKIKKTDKIKCEFSIYIILQVLLCSIKFLICRIDSNALFIWSLCFLKSVIYI